VGKEVKTKTKKSLGRAEGGGKRFGKRKRRGKGRDSIHLKVPKGVWGSPKKSSKKETAKLWGENSDRLGKSQLGKKAKKKLRERLTHLPRADYSPVQI